MSEHVKVLGHTIDNLSIDEVVRNIGAYVTAGRFGYCVTPNVDHIMRLRRDPEYRAVYAAAALRVADGVPLLWASRWLGTPLKGRVNGTDLFERLAAYATFQGWSIFLLGGAKNSAAESATVLRHRHPSLRVAGTIAPPTGFENDSAACREIEETVRESRSDILFVGLGAPKQEIWIARHGANCGVRFAIGIGVSFSFVAGAIPRAPAWMQANGLEWLWRLIREPGRLWKRYLIDDLPFFWLVMLDSLRGRVQKEFRP